MTLLKEPRFNFYRVTPMSAATSYWRSHSLACCFQQDCCQHTVKSAMALVDGLYKSQRMEMLQLSWAVFPAIQPFGEFFFPNVQSKYSNIQFVDHSPLCIIGTGKKKKSKPQTNQKKQSNQNFLSPP